MQNKPLTVRIARWSAAHAWRAIALWVVFVAACLTAGALVEVNEMSVEDGAVGESGRAVALVRAGGFDERATENVLITARAGRLDRAAAMAAAQRTVEVMRTQPGVASVTGPLEAPDGDAVLVRLTLTDDAQTAKTRIEPLLAATEEVQRSHPRLRVEQVGEASVQRGLDETLARDFRRAEFTSLPVSLLILVVAFGALVAAAVPVLLALSAVGAAIGLATLASHLVPAVNSVNSVVLLIGMAVGVDYSLFYLRREREERLRGADRLGSVEIAAETSGHAVIVSGVAVIVSMAGLYLANDAVFASFATGSILVIAVAMVGSLTVLPALLVLLGPRVDRPRVPVLWRLGNRGGRSRLWPVILRPALRHPWLTLAVSLGLLLALAAPALDMRLRFPGTEDLPRSTAVMQGYDRLTAAFPSTGIAHQVVVRAPAERSGEVRAALTDLHRRTLSDPLFAHERPEPAIDVSADGRTSTLRVSTPYPARTEQARDSLTELRGELLPATVAGVPGAEYAVGGPVASDLDYAEHVRAKLPLVIGFVLLLTFLVMAVTFRAPVVALTAIVLNLFSVAAAYGLVTVVFQGTWAEGLLDFRSIDAVVSWLPLFLFVILFGLSMDYHVFVVSRIREAVRRGAGDRDAVAQGITASASVITSAAVVMVAVFAIFGTLSTIDMKQIGIGLAAAILIDATIIRALVLPAAMTVLGRANWWTPRVLRRPTDDHDGSAAARPELVTARDSVR
ncbi:putative drug exporter of the RND superfamily [Micromonospora nigra]|uniref:Putative drug exporter of the RND superfamily n=1 Tax=Micromonospora nigra TaxID=145857 RepID=A0A1C6RC93_9ACTN|nr:MMPL family transporter [Micromonospora nigra]SCL14760.1 putative drug exporter of the RND superfamily [Micromonospora nigra]